MLPEMRRKILPCTGEAAQATIDALHVHHRRHRHDLAASQSSSDSSPSPSWARARSGGCVAPTQAAALSKRDAGLSTTAAVSGRPHLRRSHEAAALLVVVLREVEGGGVFPSRHVQQMRDELRQRVEIAPSPCAVREEAVGVLRELRRI